jgi:hypothetical protein
VSDLADIVGKVHGLHFVGIGRRLSTTRRSITPRIRSVGGRGLKYLLGICGVGLSQ